MGKLLEIAVRERSRAPMKRVERARVTRAHGVGDDARGRARGRQVVVLTREGWEAACGDLGETLPWDTRRANLLVEGVSLTGETGGKLRIGSLLLEITGECDPCQRMEEARPGLRRALEPEWRAGATCIVLEDGEIAPGDSVSLET